MPNWEEMVGFSKVKIQGLNQNNEFMNRFMKFIILLMNTVSPDIFVMGLSISWQQTHSLSCWFSQFSQCSQLHQEVFPLFASSLWPSAVLSPSESEKSCMGSKEWGSNSAIFVTVFSSVLLSQTIHNIAAKICD